jgi:aryl-alcohol dehydrogenase-like predicted oxidoreductase
MQQRTIGQQTVSAIGLGGMPMSIEGRPDRARSIAAVHASLDAGVTLIDTADAYHLGPDDVGHNEELIAEALGQVGQATPATCWWRPRAAPASRRRLVDPGRQPRAPAGGL